MFKLSMELMSEPVRAGMLREQVAVLLRHFEVDREVVERVQFVVSEAFSNVVRHAFGECRVELALDGERLIVRVADCGRRFRAAERFDVPPLYQGSGWGLYFIQCMADGLLVESSAEGGTVVTVEVDLRGAGRGV